jgi:hypothetical protein
MRSSRGMGVINPDKIPKARKAKSLFPAATLTNGGAPPKRKTRRKNDHASSTS